jgi:hypothetical protein
MPVSEREPQPLSSRRGRETDQDPARRSQGSPPAAPSMRDLLASCAAANAVSTPPCPTEPRSEATARDAA